MGEEYLTYKVGDLVRFTATVDSDVPFGCSSTMEKTLRGKIFRIKNVFQSPQFNTQEIKLEDCYLTDKPEECDLDRWTFAAPMFEPYTADNEDDAQLQAVSEITFDDFVN
jgi:hypothetical protein